ncbi:ROK family protein [Pseudarthrobacter phenanthrenivorans]|uniref:ROK family protein n=1 Tax=Pseudarthrobacter TaxID=1742993 RepID=UPI0011270A1D|nr:MULTISPECIES: ROK family protein [Pseudarthrobacter]TPV51070.1 ROK family protein [Pseudarthrobacter phenanthrenivorans]GKV73762.1 transcriptional regulator [Pseudarthrobacter sp. NCCP-2145]
MKSSTRKTEATLPVLRKISASAVMRALVSGATLDATGLMEATGLSRPTVLTVCDELLKLGWVSEIETSSRLAARSGRPSRRFTLNAAAGYVLGIDLGATKLQICLADLAGTIVSEHSERWRDEHVGAPERLMVARRAAWEVLAQAGVEPSRVMAAGMAVPAPVRPNGHAVALESYLPGLAALDLRLALLPDFDWPLIVDNDANLAVIAERWLGIAQDVDDVVVLLSGERLGAGIYLGGQLIRGGGAAGEMRFLELVEGVGNTDAIGGMCRELGAIAAAEILDGERPGHANDSELLQQCGGIPASMEAEMVINAARKGDPAAREVLEVVTERTARVIAVVATFLDPQMIVLSGGPAGAGDVLIPSLNKELDGLNSAHPHLAASTLTDHAPLLGAVRVALNHAFASLLV